MISSLPGINNTKLDSVMESLQRQRMLEQQAQLHQAMQALRKTPAESDRQNRYFSSKNQ